MKKIKLKKVRQLNENSIGLIGWMICQNLFIIIGSVCAFALVDFFANRLFYHQPDYHPIDALGMVIPICIITGLITGSTLKRLYNYLRRLTGGISEVAGGNYRTQLDESMGGPLKEVYHDFNVMTKELASVEDLRNDFLNSFAHEFRTPLASINGFANLLLDESVPPEKQREYLEIIAGESQRLADLATSQMMYSKLSTQQVITDKTTYDLDEQIRQCVILLAPQWSQKSLTPDLELDPIQFCGNRELMQQVWINLFSNAIKYTPENRTFGVRTQVSADEILIRVFDTGIGIPPEQLDHIFDKYYQVNSQVSRGKGIGMGLSIARKIVELSGGRISVESTSGEGCSFLVRLPRGIE